MSGTQYIPVKEAGAAASDHELSLTRVERNPIYNTYLKRCRFRSERHSELGRAPLMSILLALLFSPALTVQLAAQKVRVEYERAADFSKFKTYAWVPGTPLFDPTLDADIRNSVIGVLQQRGMTEAGVGVADLLVTYHAAVNTDLSVGTALDPTFAASGGVPVPGHSAWEVAGAGATHVTKGSLTVEMVDRAANRPVWSGTAKHTVSDMPHERWEQIQKALDKLFRRFPPKRSK